jgi:hypothetical protein
VVGIPSRRLLLLATLAALPSCAAGTYLGDRGRDFADIFTLTGSIGPEISADAKLTEAAHLAVGIGGHLEAGMIKGEWGSAPVITLGLPFAPFIENGILHGRYVFTETGGDWDDLEVQDECYIIHFLDVGATNPQRAWVDRFDLELGVTIGIGARVGFSPGQFVDFLGGCFGWDPAKDDPLPGPVADTIDAPSEAATAETTS